MTRNEELLAYMAKVVRRGSKPGLSRIRELMERLGNPQNDLKFIHIGGTNGKGSTAAGLASIFKAAGYKTGLYISPFIFRFNERIQINNEPISDEELESLIEEIRPTAESMDDRPTEFELYTAIGMLYYQRHHCDIVVLEVGMGGEFDATNVIQQPELAILTAIGLDHTAILGDTLEKIAATKSGIIKGGEVVMYPGTEGVQRVVSDACDNASAKLTVADFGRLSEIHYNDAETVFNFGGWEDIHLSLQGSYQPRNAAVVLTAVERLRQLGWKIEDSAVYTGLALVSWPGRFQKIGTDPTFVVDGAHNPHGIAAAVESIKTYFSDKKVTILMGVMADKDHKTMVSALSEVSNTFVTVTPINERSLEADALADELRMAGCKAQACETVSEGVSEAIRLAGKDGVVVALGSLYFSADVRRAVDALK